MDRLPGTLSVPYEDAVSNLVWIKLVGIGNANVGKTCLIKHFCESKFNSGYQPTVGVDYGFKVQELQGVDLRVHLWDLSGSSEYFDVRNELYSGTDAIFLVYDVTNMASFESLDQWIREVKRYANGDPEIFIVGNKIDLKQKRAVTSTEGKKYAQANKFKYAETSAANGDGVLTMFDTMLQTVCDKQVGGAKRPEGAIRREAQASEIYHKQARS
ncbi:dnaJ homolog subfamily C member 27 [Aplysia californica]|uniref:DnaJ homolog subfamily C member 27 n=1 Tax=Aplysia californica TaxID=6500 RepID=A0ABM0JQH2_APLCA|nr:dnaJ homolog subfamily C member 27 [Aplysia californica]